MRRTTISSGIALSAIAAFALSACGGSAATGAPSIAIPSIAIPSVAIPSIAIPSIDLPSFDIPTGGIASFAIPTFHAAPDLEARLPAQVRGVTLEKSSFSGQEFLAGGSSSNAEFTALLAQFGKQPGDLAVAGARDPGTTDTRLDFDLIAFRLAGIDANQLLGTFIAASPTPKPTTSSANIGGKQVTVLVDGSGTKSYAYATGDVLYSVSSSATDADALVADILAALP